MAAGYTRTYGTSGIPIWQGLAKDIQLAQGGFLLTTTGLADNTVIPAGTPIVFSESARTATFTPTGILYTTAGGTDTAYNVTKGHTFKVGDYFATGATGGKAYAITAIDTTTSSAYDIITVGTSVGAATAGDTFYGSTATGATASALAAANGLLYEDVLVRNGFKTSISVVIAGTVYARRIGYNASLAALTGLSRIIFSQSK